MDVVRAEVGTRRSPWVLLGVLAMGLVSWSGCTVKTEPMPVDGGPGIDAQVDAAVVASDAARFPRPTIDPCTPEGMGATLGQSCASTAACDDGCYCNGAELCEEGVCVVGVDPCADGVECTADVCLEEANRCFHDRQHELCTDGDACNGAELCDPVLGCTSGAPLYCNDEDSCTIDACDPTRGCVFDPRDLDGDGFTDGRCGGDDCDDDPRFGAAIHPGATEDCMNRRDDDCDGSRDYNDSACLPTNDTCSSAVVLGGEGTYSASTAGLAGDYELGCRSSGPDAVFRFSLTEPMDVTVTVAGGGSGAAVALRPFDSCAIPPDDKCGTGSPPTFLRRSLPAGEWAIIVKTSSGSAFDLSLRLGPPTPIPPVDVCGPGTEDLCGGAACGNITDAPFAGMFAETEDDYTLSCASGTSSRRDAAYTFTLDAPKDVTLRATTRDESGSRTAYLSVVGDCEDAGTELRCDSGNPAEFRQREMPPGRYFVLIESSDSAPVAWDLTATITDPVPRNPGDACSTAIDISEPSPGAGGAGSADLSMMELDSGTACGGTSSSYRDATFVFSLGSTRDVALLTNAGGSTHYVSLQTVCGDAASDIRCWSGSGDLGQSWRSLPPGTYYVTVSTTRSSGSINAGIATSDPTPIPPNDRCAGAIELTNGSSRRDTTIGFEDDAPGGTCAGTGRPDAFYFVDLAARQRVLINVTDADMGSSTFYVTLRDFCGGTSTASTVCVTGAGSATINTTLDPGIYYVQVETTSTGTSDFNIDTFLLAP